MKNKRILVFLRQFFRRELPAGVVNGVGLGQDQPGDGHHSVAIVDEAGEDGGQRLRRVQRGVVEQHDAAGLDLGGHTLADGVRIVAIGITSDPGSDFRTHADLLIDYGCGQESVGYVTMGVTALCLFLCLFALRSAHLAGRLSEDGLAAERQKLAQWADAYEQTIPAGEALLRSRYRQLSAMQTVCIAGAGAAWGVAREAALKLMETLQIPACAYELEEFLHGPELHLTPNHTLFFLASDPHDRARGAQLSRAASLVTEKTFFFTDDGGDLPVPSSPDPLLTPLLFLPFFQLTAYRLTEDLHRWHKHPLVADFESAVSGKSANYVSKEVL